MDSTLEKLCDPLSEEAPCGTDLEDTALLSSFDAYRVFGQMTPPSDETDWREVNERSLEALQESRDIRLLAHLGAARLRVGGVAGLCDTLQVAGRWFSNHPAEVFPRVDEDAILRRNALNCLADRMAIVEALRRQPFVAVPQLGSFGLRDFEVATGKAPAPTDADAPTEALLNGALSELDGEQLSLRNSSVQGAIAALQQIDASMRDSHGPEGAPDFEPLLTPLVEIHRILQAEMDRRAASAAPAGEAESADASAPGAVAAVGNIRSRDDAIRALDAVAEFFRKNEPSSPVPVVVERAKMLVAKDFFEIIADMAPDGLAQAQQWGPRVE